MGAAVITPEDLKRWKELDEKATPGPWRIDRGTHNRIQYQSEDDFGGSYWTNLTWPDNANKTEAYVDQDAQFIAEARTAMPKLISEVIRLRETLERIVKHTESYNSGPDAADCAEIAREALESVKRKQKGGGKWATKNTYLLNL